MTFKILFGISSAGDGAIYGWPRLRTDFINIAYKRTSAAAPAAAIPAADADADDDADDDPLQPIVLEDPPIMPPGPTAAQAATHTNALVGWNVKNTFIGDFQDAVLASIPADFAEELQSRPGFVNMAPFHILAEIESAFGTISAAERDQFLAMHVADPGQLLTKYSVDLYLSKIANMARRYPATDPETVRAFLRDSKASLANNVVLQELFRLHNEFFPTADLQTYDTLKAAAGPRFIQFLINMAPTPGSAHAAVQPAIAAAYAAMPQPAPQPAHYPIVRTQQRHDRRPRAHSQRPGNSAPTYTSAPPYCLIHDSTDHAGENCPFIAAHPEYIRCARAQDRNRPVIIRSATGQDIAIYAGHANSIQSGREQGRSRGPGRGRGQGRGHGMISGGGVDRPRYPTQGRVHYAASDEDFDNYEYF